MTGESSGIDTASLSKKANLDKEPKSTETSALEVAVPLKDSEYTEDDKSDPESGNTVLPDDDDTEVNGLIVDQDHKADNEVELQKTDFPFKKNESQCSRMELPKTRLGCWGMYNDQQSSDDLPERSDEYVKTDLLEEGNDSKIEGKDVSTSDLEDKESAPPSTLGDSSSEREKSLAGESEEDVERKNELESSGETASEASASQPAGDEGEELVEERASEGSTANDEDASHGE
ncbi:protein IWS1 homolog [Macrobrachium rosenbergii]|uniref:protein IWS1 homolog n=1 Tax=Macrobrachium rosenbergii TaxID=79674 RepID=UPI0034D4F539